MLNKAIIMGRLTKEPEIRYTQSQTAVTSFTLACDRDYGENGHKQTDFINCVAWRGTAEVVSKYFTKGSMAVVVGRIQVRDWQDNNGNKRQATEIVADSVYFGESKKPERGERLTVNISAADFGDLEDADTGMLPF